MDAVFHFDDVEKSLLTTSPAVKKNTVDELSAIIVVDFIVGSLCRVV